MTEATLNSSGESEFGYGQIFGVLLRRWIWIAGAIGLGLAGGAYVSIRQEPTYTSSMQLIVEPNFEKDVTQADLTGLPKSQANETDYATQLNLMRSNQFIKETVDKLKNEYPDLTPEAASKSFVLSRVVEGSKDAVSTRIVEAKYTDNDPVRSQKFLETLKKIYLNYNQEQQSDRLNRGVQRVNERLSNTRENLGEAQSALELFRQKQNLIDPSLQAQAAVEALNQVQNEQRQLLSELKTTESRSQILQQQLVLSPQSAVMAARLSQSGRLQELLNTLQKANLQLADLRIIFTDQDPEVQYLIEQRNNQLAELREEIGSITQQPPADLNAAVLSLLQLGQIDLSLVADLIEADVELKSMDARRQSLSQLESGLRKEINSYPSLIAEYDRLQPSVEIERTTLQQLLAQREQLSAELDRGGFNWQVVALPNLGVPFEASRLRPLLLGGVVGLFLGGMLVFVREGMDKVVRTSDELKKQVPLPLLGILPPQMSRRSFSLGGQEVIPVATLHPELTDSDLIQTIIRLPFRESLDLIANTLQLLQTERVPKAFAITSGLPGEGKTTLTLGLALSFARMNQRVLVIDADLRRSGIQTELGLTVRGGLSTYLQKQGAVQPHRLDFLGKYVDILPAGESPLDPITLLSSPRFETLITKSKKFYDIVLVDTPPVLGMADALKVGAICDSTVLVARLDQITQQELTKVLALLTPINVLGIVANGGRDGSARYVNYSSQVHASAQTDR